MPVCRRPRPEHPPDRAELDGRHGDHDPGESPVHGRQVWNRQRTDTELADPAHVTLGHKSVQRWNLPGGWVISSRPAHPALVSEADFVAAQAINAARGGTARTGGRAFRTAASG